MTEENTEYSWSNSNVTFNVYRGWNNDDILDQK